MIRGRKTFVVVSTLGGTVTALNLEGIPIIFPEREVNGKSRGGIPICFPFFGSPKPNYAEFQRHGWLRHQELDVLCHTENCLVLQGKNEFTKSYPWRLKYRVVITVDCFGGLIIELEVKRLKDWLFYNAPINPAFHPYFCADDSEKVIAKGLARVGSDVIADFPLQAKSIAAQESILLMSGGKKVEMLLCEGFDANSRLTLWSDDPEQYFCVEPVLTPPDEFDSLGGKFLKQGEKFRMSICLHVV